MKIMDELLDEFLKTWKKENNTEEAVYSAYHYDAMIAFAKYYHQSKVNNGVLGGVSVLFSREQMIDFADSHNPDYDITDEELNNWLNKR